MKFLKLVFLSLPILLVGCDAGIPAKEHIIRIDSSVVVTGSIYTNGQWVSVGKISIPSGHIVGPFSVSTTITVIE